MPLTLDDVDSPILNDVQASFIGGQFSNAVPLQLAQDQAALLEDVEVSITGGATPRRGCPQLGPNVGIGTVMRGAGFYQKNSTTSYAVACSDTSIKKWTGSVWAQIGSATFNNGNQPLIFVPGNGFLYATDGGGNIEKWNDSTWTAVTNDSAPTNVQFLVWHEDRLVAANATVGGNPSYDGVFFSGILDDTIWSSLQGGYQLQPGAGDGQPITGLVPWSNYNLAVFKRNSVWLIVADPQLNVSDMPVINVHRRIGCIAPLSAVEVGNDIFFLSQDGVRSLQQTIASKDRYQLGTPLSFPVDDVIRRINPSAASGAVATFWKGMYLLAVPLDTSTYNNYILVYNSIIGKWTGGWTNLPVSSFGIWTDTGVDKLMLGLSNAPVLTVYQDFVSDALATDATYQDYNNNYVNPHVITRGMVFGDLDSPKKGLNANIKLYKSKGQITISALFDEGALTATKTIDTGDPFGFNIPFTLPITFPRPGVQPCSMPLLPYPKFHQVQFELTGIGAGRKEIRQITAQAFPEATDLRGKFEAQ